MRGVARAGPRCAAGQLHGTAPRLLTGAAPPPAPAPAPAPQVQEAPKVAGPDALIKQKIKQTRFRCGRGPGLGLAWGALRHVERGDGQPPPARPPSLQLQPTRQPTPPRRHPHPRPPAPPRREGYEEGLSTTHKVLPAAAFVHGDNPIEMLGQYTAIAVEGPNSEGALACACVGRGWCWCRCWAWPGPRGCAGLAPGVHRGAMREDAHNKSNSTGLSGAGETPPRAVETFFFTLTAPGVASPALCVYAACCMHAHTPACAEGGLMPKTNQTQQA